MKTKPKFRMVLSLEDFDALQWEIKKARQHLQEIERLTMRLERVEVGK